MSSVPPGWTSAAINEVGEVQLGRQRSPEHHFGDHMRPYLRVANVFENRIDLSDVLEMNFTPAEFERFALKFGDILLNEGQSRELVGRPAMFRDDLPGVCFQNTLVRFRAGEAVVPAYALAVFRWFFRIGAFQRISKWSTNIAHLGAERFAALEFPLPPLAEQKRIADKLDGLLGRLDTCRERLDVVHGIVKRFRQSVLAAATSGRLTEDWRSERGFDLGCWKSVGLSGIGELGRGKSKHRPRNDQRLYGGPYPFIQTGAIAQSGGRIDHHEQTYSELGLAQSRLWPAETLCITIAANIADTALLSYPACFPDSVVGFIADEEQCLPEFVKWTIDVMSYELNEFAPATAQKNINLNVLNEVRFQLPSLAEQQLIVSRAKRLFALVDTLESRLTEARAQVERLTPALLAKAFRGELAPQDPNDEPADVLLQRLRDSNAAPAKSRRGRRAD